MHTFLPGTRNVAIPVTARSKAWVCGLSLAGTAGSYSAANVAVFCECCEFSGRSLGDGPIPRPEESYQEKERQRGCVCGGVCVCVCVSEYVQVQQ
jgi:hypothetical protein